MTPTTFQFLVTIIANPGDVQEAHYGWHVPVSASSAESLILDRIQDWFGGLGYVRDVQVTTQAVIPAEETQ